MINLLFNKIKYILNNLVVNLLNILLTIVLYLILIVYLILFIFNINNIEKIIKYYLKFISLIVGISLIYILYKSVVFIVFLFILFVFIFFSLIIITYKNSLFKVSNKFIHLILSKDYIFLIQRILLVKFLLLYVYITTDYSYCDSFITRAMHDVFVNVGKTSHVEPQQTVSTMETMGMLATIGLVAYGGIKLYQLSTKKLPKSTNDKLDEMEKRIMKKLEDDKTELSKKIEDNKVELFKKIEDNKVELYDKIEETQVEVFFKMEQVHTSVYYNAAQIGKSVETAASISQEEYVKHFTALGIYLNILDTQIRELKAIVSNTDHLNQAELFDNLNRIEGLIVKSNEIRKKSKNLTTKDLEEFDILQEELSKELKNYSTISSNLPLTSNLSLRPHTSFDPLNNSMRVYRENVFRNNQSVIGGLADKSPIVKARSLSDTNILYTSVDTLTSTPREISTGIINRATIRAFHVGPETIINVIRDQLSSILQGSITYTAFVSVLQALGVIGEIPSNSENVGRIISRNIREFITAISRGIGNK